MKLFLTISYDGSSYQGFQKQPDAATVQGTLEDALIKIFPRLKESCFSEGSGRTDSGVHADEQIVTFPVDKATIRQIKQITLSKLPRILNSCLPSDIYVSRTHLVEKKFHPRYRARIRCYRYRIKSCPGGSPPFMSDTLRYFVTVPYSIEINILEKYFQVLEGQHDFSSFASKIGRDDRTPNPVRKIFKIDIIKKGQDILIDVYAESFLRGMVRSIIGNVLYYYQKGSTPQMIRRILEAKDPALAKHRVPGRALFLRRVFFLPLFGGTDS